MLDKLNKPIVNVAALAPMLIATTLSVVNFVQYQHLNKVSLAIIQQINTNTANIEAIAGHLGLVRDGEQEQPAPEPEPTPEPEKPAAKPKP